MAQLLAAGGDSGQGRGPMADAPAFAQEDLQREYDELTELFLSETSMLTDPASGASGDGASGLEIGIGAGLLEPPLRRGEGGVSPVGKGPGEPARYEPALNKTGLGQQRVAGVEPPGLRTRAPAAAPPQEVIQGNVNSRTDITGRTELTGQIGVSGQTDVTGVTCVVVGHLGDTAPAVLRRYLDVLAMEEPRAVALITLAAAMVTVEVRTGPGVRGLAGVGSEMDLCGVLGVLARERARVVVHVDELSEVDLLSPCAPAEHPLMLVERAFGGNHGDRTGGKNAKLRVLSGTDDTSVVASYRAVRHATTAGAGLEVTGGGLEVCVVEGVNGPGRGAAEAVERLSRTCRAFLGGRVPVVAVGAGQAGQASHAGHESRAAVARQVVYRGSGGAMAGAGVWSYVGAMARDGGVPAAGWGPKAASNVSSTMGMASVPRVQRVQGATYEAPFEGEQAAWGQRHGVCVPGAGAVGGLRVLTVSSPYTPRVEFAVDRGNTLHLVTTLERGTGRLASECVGELLTAAAWAADHAALLSIAVPGVRETSVRGAGPTLHIVTEEARRVLGVLHAGVKVHLAALVEGRWLCTEMN